MTGPEVHPTSSAIVTGSLPTVKWPERGADHPTTSSADTVNGLEQYLHLSTVPDRRVME